MVMPPIPVEWPEYPDDMKSTRIQGLVRTMICVTLLATLTCAAAVILTGSEAIAETIAQANIAVIFQVMLLVIVGYAWRFVRWDNFARQLGHRIPTGLYSLYYIAGLAFSATPGKAGKVVKPVYLRKHGLGYANSVGMLVAERALDVVVMGLLLLLVLAWFQQYVPWIAGALAALFVGISLLVYGSGIRSPRTLLKRVPSQRLRPMLEHLNSTLASTGQVLGLRSLGLGISLGLFAWGSEGTAFYMLADAFGIELPLALAAGIYSLPSSWEC